MIFISHASRQKFLVRELIANLPSSIECWLDEKEILIGDNIEKRIEDGILNECELFILILDMSAAKSNWVRKELSIIQRKEKETKKSLLLPIVIDQEALDELSDFNLKKIKYISMHDFSEYSLNSLSLQITNELLARLIREKKNLSPNTSKSISTIVINANESLEHVAAIIRDVLFVHRRTNPISIENLLRKLNVIYDFDLPSQEDLKLLLDQLRSSNLLAGFYYNKDHAFLLTERMSAKSDLNLDLKRKISLNASALIEPGMKIGIDGGSTTLELAKEIGNLIKAKALEDIEIYTNSIDIAHYILGILNSMDVGDKDAVCRVTLIGGWCRPVSLSTVTPSSTAVETLISQGILAQNLNISFIGANGVCGNCGFGNTHEFEMPAKQYLAKNADLTVYLLESRKLVIQQKILIEEFKHNMKLYTDDSVSIIDDAEDIFKAINKAGGEIIVIDT